VVRRSVATAAKIERAAETPCTAIGSLLSLNCRTVGESIGWSLPTVIPQSGRATATAILTLEDADRSARLALAAKLLR
jgi:hypothetical protein